MRGLCACACTCSTTCLRAQRATAGCSLTTFLVVQDFSDSDQGDALNAMNIALALEKLNFEKITAMSEVAEQNGDAQFADFIDEMLQALPPTSRTSYLRSCCIASLVSRQGMRDHGSMGHLSEAVTLHAFDPSASALSVQVCAGAPLHRTRTSLIPL